MEYRICYPDELYHYGVKGMKWGVRHDPQPSSFRSSVLAGTYAATGSERIGRALDRSNDRDAVRQKKAIAKREQSRKRMSTAKKVAIGVAVTAAVAGITYAAVKTGKTKQVSVGAKLVHTKTPKELAKNVYNGRKIVKPNKNLGRFSAGTSTGKYTIRTLDRTPPRYKNQRIYNLSRNTYGHNKISYSNRIKGY